MSDSAHVWMLSPGVLSSFEGLTEKLLDRDEKIRLSRISNLIASARWGQTRSALRYVLAGYVRQDPEKLVFEYGSRGKPVLVNSGGVEFSLSHSHGYAVIAVAQNTTIGVDIEKIRTRSYDELAERILGPSATVQYKKLDPQTRSQAFALAWSEREAFAKMLGIGIGDGWEQLLPLFAKFALNIELESRKHNSLAGYSLHYLKSWPNFATVMCSARPQARIEVIRPSDDDNPLSVSGIDILS
ncbi:MAG: 4'-phosphopantetheinyl transferase superfamily protein [Gammaproteobacteria bacterium]|nr:4'-phosphopantetheinyl transferase superfamily protein [Gammaproteobacteria bacterium]